jgi:hypothetical protein
MIHVSQHFFGVDQNLMAPLPFDVRNKTYAARIMFVRRVVQALL